MANVKPDVESDFQKKIAEKLSTVFEATIKDKEEYYRSNPNKIPTRSEVKAIISACAYKNAAITGSLALIPGPFGLVAAVPEIYLIIKNQIAMVYDLGIAYGQGKVLKKEVLMYIVVSAMGNATGALAVMQGSKLLIKRSSLGVMQQLIKKLAGSIAQKLLKSSVVRFLPLLGAAVLATWTKISTTSIGNKAAEIFEREIEYDDSSENTDGAPESPSSEVVFSDVEIEKERILCLIALIKADGQIADEELEFIKPVIDDLDVLKAEKLTLLNLITSKDKVTYNLEAFKNNTGEAIQLMIELVALAKRDSEFHPSEKFLIKQIGKQLNFSESDIADLL